MNLATQSEWLNSNHLSSQKIKKLNKLKNLQNRNCVEGNSENLEHIGCSDQWPEDYFDKLGKWTGETLQRPSQGSIEQRETLTNVPIFI